MTDPQRPNVSDRAEKFATDPSGKRLDRALDKLGKHADGAKPTIGRKAAKMGAKLHKDLAPVRRREPAEQLAELERVAREHGADLSEEGFNEALRRVGRRNA